jgi:hypothetical protein
MLPYCFIVNVPLREVGYEYGMGRHSPENIQKAVEASLSELRGALVGTDDNELGRRGTSREHIQFQIEKIQQWLNNEPIDSLGDWDYLYANQVDYWKHFAPVGELKQIVGRSSPLVVDDAILRSDPYSGSKWLGLLRLPAGELGQSMDLTERQQIELQKIWNLYCPTGREPFKTKDDYLQLLQDIESVLTPRQAVLGFQVTVAAWGPFRIFIHPASSAEYELSQDDRLELISLVKREREQIRSLRHDMRVNAYRAVLDSLELEVRNHLIEKLGMSPDRIANCLAEVARDEMGYPIIPLPYMSFDEYYDHGRTHPLNENSLFRKLLRANGWDD